MTKKVSTLEIRQRLGDVLNRVALRHDQFIIERKGKPLAAMIPVEKLQQVERLARQQALAALDRQRGGSLTQREAEKLAAEAKRWARKRRRKRK